MIGKNGKLTSQQYSRFCAACFLLFVVAVGITIGIGDLVGAFKFICIFFLGALCSSYGAMSREKKAIEEKTERLKQEVATALLKNDQKADDHSDKADWQDKINEREDKFVAGQLIAKLNDPNYVPTPLDEQMAALLVSEKQRRESKKANG